jgi:2-dehydropantoate 2-reductase
MRTLVVGAGATGGYFGGRLVQADRDVTFLVREKRAAALAERGLRILDPAGGTERITVRTVTATALDEPYDLVVLAVKAFGLAGALADLAPAVGPDTVIVPLLNGMRHLDELEARFGPQRAYGGVCRVATMLDRNGDIVRLRDFQSLRYGPLPDAPTDRLAEVHAALSGAGFDSTGSTGIVADMWDKWVLLAALGALTCLMRGAVGEVVSAPGGLDFAAGIIAETTAVATAAGHPPSPTAADQLRRDLTDPGSALTSSMFRDLTQGFPVESEAIIADLVARAAKLGVATPLLSLANTHLSVYAARAATD